MMNHCIINGKIIRSSDAAMPLADLGSTRGYGLFDFFRAHGQSPLYLEDHLDRLFGGLSRMGIQIDYTREALTTQIHEMLSLNEAPGFTGVRILVTGGTAGGFSLDKPGVIITQEPIKPPADKLYKSGATVLLDAYTRELPAVKSTNYMHAVLRNVEMQSEGAIDLLYHTNGVLTECARSNFFMVKAGTLYTPDLDVLHGITRRRVIELARGRFDTRIEQVTIDDVMEADEIFITSTIKRVLPVSQVVGMDRSWEVGDVTRELIHLLADRDSRETSKN